MARIAVKDCLEKVFNRFELVVLASKKAKQLFKVAKPLLETDNLEIVTALRETACVTNASFIQLRGTPQKKILIRQLIIYGF